MNSKKAIITGITGQDGAYLAKLLLEKGYKVIGAHRRSSSGGNWRLEYLGIANKVQMVPFELLEPSNITSVISSIQPDEFYNLAAQSFVKDSFAQPIYTTEVDGLAVTRILEAIRTTSPRTKFYQASTSEMFGKVQEVPQTEQTPFYPRSPYAAAKLYAHWMTVNYREAYGMFACSGILFNHESPLRGLEFVTRKITHSLTQIKAGKLDVLELGNLDAKRDWGFAGDYVEGMWLMLQSEKPDDYVMATGKTHSVREFCELACEMLDIKVKWRGKGANEEGIDTASGETIIRVNPDFYRPAEVDLLIGDPSKARRELAWESKVGLRELVEMMVDGERPKTLWRKSKTCK